MKPETRTGTLPPIEQQPTPPDALLDRVVASSTPPERVEGVAVGRIDALDVDGRPTVSIDAWGLTGLPARSVVNVDAQRLGQAVALGFESADPLRPIILGFMIAPQAPVPVSVSVEARVDGQRVVLSAEQEIELRCGEAAIILTADGQIQLRGNYITSYATATQRILGGSVNLN
ncbi:DUF6484 domain-containing protein [Ralstonia syzygii subsp. celebesensis]|uniref:DUF6484 domain-containing protein n=2 Tax=Ralstonia syzygii subsp. celebesensis TaxID=1310168 RepID=A0A1U9VEG5_9RALS|nr:DUF6484 domain-containing protein [Ralstonia syzygii]AQW29074.1 hypothetical protein B0B51_02920 [blood disease bacterium A2-HR MARDI]AXW62440.1 hypothetical protein CJO94_11405 [Ralstonia solanacearum]QQV54383.1 hypothetical protein JK151_09200 [Ralstonia syzygii subsp. celebesensis]CCA79346.1 conserved hypothetical protein [blood disease bacterium R229]